MVPRTYQPWDKGQNVRILKKISKFDFFFSFKTADKEEDKGKKEKERERGREREKERERERGQEEVTRSDAESGCPKLLTRRSYLPDERETVNKLLSQRETNHSMENPPAPTPTPMPTPMPTPPVAPTLWRKWNRRTGKERRQKHENDVNLSQRKHKQRENKLCRFRKFDFIV